jgi:sulfur-oxidizing protein SoxY
MPTNHGRRSALKAGSAATVYALAVSAGLIKSAAAQSAGAWNKAAFDGKTLQEATKAMGAGQMTESAEVRFTSPTPDIAENGAVVPVTVTSGLPKTQQISILVPKNPLVLIASFDLGEGMDPFVSTRIKMGETSDVYALVKADNRFFFAKKEIKVTIGGCGG